MWIIIAIVIVILIVIAAVVGWTYMGSEPAVSEVSPSTPVSVGPEAAIAAGAPASSSTIADVAVKTDSVPVVVTPNAPVEPPPQSAVLEPAVAPRALDRYTFIQGADINGADITRRPELENNPAALAVECERTPNCVSFNHQGYLKNVMRDPAKLNRYPDWASNPAAGLYYKTGVAFEVPAGTSGVPGYTFEQGLDMYGFDMPARTDLAGNVPQLAQLCTADPMCAGFNTAGYLKNTVFKPMYLMPWNVGQPNAGFYYKPTRISPPVVLIFTNTTGTADGSTVAMGPGSGVLSTNAKFIQVPRNMSAILTLGSQATDITGFRRMNIAAMAGGTITVRTLQS